MNGRFLPALLLLVPVVAGCVAPATEVDPALADGALPTLLPGAISFRTCDEHLGVFPFPMAAARSFAPDDFTPVPLDPAGQTAVLFLVSIRCDEVAVDGAAAGEGSEAYVILAVTPPEALRHENENAVHGLLLDHVTSSEAAHAAYDAWGIESATGRVEQSRTDTPLVRVATSTVHEDGGSPFSMRVVTQRAGQEADGVARFFEVAEGEVMGGYDMAWLATGGAEGEAVLDAARIGGISLPSLPGIGFLYWKDGDRYTKTPFDLPAGAEDA